MRTKALARLAPPVTGLALGALALGPGLGRGFLLSYDMVFVPHPPLTAAALGLAGGPPRPVPSDAVVAVFSHVLPSDIVQKLILLLVFTLACWGGAALLADLPWAARLAAGVFYSWNPYVAERLILGQWALLLGYAGLPWVLRALAAGLDDWRRVARLCLALVPAAVGGFAAMSVSALVAVSAALVVPVSRAMSASAVPVTAVSAGPVPPSPVPASPPSDRRRVVTMPSTLTSVRPSCWASGVARARSRTACGVCTSALPAGAVSAKAGRAMARLAAAGSRAAGSGWYARARTIGTGVLVLAAVSLPWLVPSLARPVHTSAAGVGAFAARADTPFGSLGSLLILGGGWNAGTVPKGYGGALSTFWLALAVTGIAGYATRCRRDPRWPGLGVAALAGLAIASIGITAGGREILGALIGGWPGFAVLRDSQQFVAPLALAEATGIGAVVAWGVSVRQPFGIIGEEGRWRARADLPGVVFTVAALLAPPLLLPGLAWGAAARLRTAQYPGDWLRARAAIDAGPSPGSALLLPWAAYRRYGWNRGEPVLDPWPRMLARTVIWNDAVRVGSVVVPAEDPAARTLSRLITSRAPLTVRLRAAGVRYVIVDAGLDGASAGGAGSLGSASELARRLAGAAVVLTGPDIVVYRLDGHGAGATATSVRSAAR